MTNQTFGIEIETVGRTRALVAKAIHSVVGGTVTHVGAPHCYDPFHVTDDRGRTWKVMADSSLSAAKERQAEIVSPILTAEDIPELQRVVRAVRKIGARCDHSAGIHVHVNAALFDARAVRNLVKIVNKQEDLIYHALGVSESRRALWCKGVDQGFLAKIESERPETLDELNVAWYGYFNPNPIHYDSSRYQGVNLHSLWQKSTVEFRLFNSTLHAGKVKAYIQFCLALSAFALNARSASSKRRPFNPNTAKFDFRTFLVRIGMVGDEFKTARLHLLANLEGNSAWKHGRPEALAA